jgi:hypothetical protein
MENTKPTTATSAAKDGFWRSEPLPHEDKPATYPDRSWGYGYRIIAGMATCREAEYGSLPPAAFTGME